MGSEEIEIVLKIGSRFYEGRVHPQPVVKQAEIPTVNAPAIPETYAGLLSIRDEGAAWILRPKEFLRKEDFAEILRIVKQYKGEYVSAGRSSYFKIPK